VRIRPHDREIGVGARAWLVRVGSRDPKIGRAATTPRVPVPSRDRGWGRRIGGGKEAGEGGRGESAGSRGQAAVTGRAGDRGDGAGPHALRPRRGGRRSAQPPPVSPPQPGAAREGTLETHHRADIRLRPGAGGKAIPAARLSTGSRDVRSPRAEARIELSSLRPARASGKLKAGNRSRNPEQTCLRERTAASVGRSGPGTCSSLARKPSGARFRSEAVKKSIQNHKSKIQDGCKSRPSKVLRSLNRESWIFDPILSQTQCPRPPAF
jgi:hypothetical protein